MAKILLVDDDDLVRSAISELLEDAGYDVREAASGNIAIECLETEPFDLVVTDIYMPIVGGIEPIQHVRDSMPALKVIAFSGGGMHQDPKFATNLATTYGADRVLQKPVDNDTMLDAIAGMLGD